MKTVILGTGGVGGYFGGLLARGGLNVTFVARGAHLKAIRGSGLQVRSVHGDFSVSPATATDAIAEIGPADLVLVCVKDYQLDGVLPDLQTLVDEGTAVIPLLNGVRAAERLKETLGKRHVMGGLCKVVAYKVGPGVIQQSTPFHEVAFGEWDGKVTQRAQDILAAFQEAGLDADLSADIRKAMWTKFLFITAYSGVASVVRMPAAGIQASQETMGLMRQAMEEIEAVARAKGIDLDEDVVPNTMDFVEGLPAGMTASMQRDVEEGHMFELEALTGSLVQYGAETGVPTPANSFVYAALKPHEMRARNENYA